MLTTIKNNSVENNLSTGDLAYMFKVMYTDNMNKKISFAAFPLISNYYEIIYALDMASSVGNHANTFYLCLKKYKGHEREVLVMQELVTACKLNILDTREVIAYIKKSTNGNAINLALNCICDIKRLTLTNSKQLRDNIIKFTFLNSAFPNLNGILCTFVENNMSTFNYRWVPSIETLITGLRFCLDNSDRYSDNVIKLLYEIINRYDIGNEDLISVLKVLKSDTNNISNENWKLIYVEIEDFLRTFIGFLKAKASPFCNGDDVNDRRQSLQEASHTLTQMLSKFVDTPNQSSKSKQVKRLNLFD